MNNVLIGWLTIGLSIVFKSGQQGIAVITFKHGLFEHDSL